MKVFSFPTTLSLHFTSYNQPIARSASTSFIWLVSCCTSIKIKDEINLGEAMEFTHDQEISGNGEHGGLADLARQLYRFVYCIICGSNLGHDTQSDILFAFRFGKGLVLLAEERIHSSFQKN
jgi:hypothetical protein